MLVDIRKRFEALEDFRLTLTKLGEGEKVLWDGCVGAGHALITTATAEALNRPLLVLASKVSDVERIASDIALFTNRQVLSFPILSSLPEEGRQSEIFYENDAEFGARLRVLKELDSFETDSSSPAPIVVASMAAILQPVPSKGRIVDDSMTLCVGKDYNRTKLTSWLVEGGFHNASAVELSGEYSVRGDVIDIYAVDWDEPVRLEFWGDTLESIRSFDIASQLSNEALDSVTISRLEAGGECDTSFVDRLAQNAIVVFHDFDMLVHSAKESAFTNNDKNVDANTVNDYVNKLLTRPCLQLVGMASGAEPADYTLCCNFGSVERFQGSWNIVIEAFKNVDKRQRFVLVCSSEAEIVRLKETFSLTAVERDGRISYVVGEISDGFEWHDERLVIMGSDQLFGRTIGKRSKKANAKKKKLALDSDAFLQLSPGDLVVHVDHGLARFRGISQVRRDDRIVDELELEFADHVVYRVATSQIGKIQRYVGAGNTSVPPKLGSLNSRSWQKKKTDVQQATFKYAMEMAELQARRELAPGIAFEPDGDEQAQFEAMFPYQETPDQLTAIAQIKEDMERPRPMDRLLCGDVGFGKTEVALRAAFKAVQSGRQVAVVAPTTVLAAQHFRTFCDRTEPFAFKVGLLSRYRTKKEQAETMRALKEGKIDIVIGTHRILSKDIEFHDLGLLIIDEEQKFGVEQKERLKLFHNQVDVLTMSATPIPRTLHFSLMNIRDVSNLTTPPADRLPVETKVLRFDRKVIREAILRELNRGGQVYFLHNRVYDIDALAKDIADIVPEAKIQVGHAQMEAEELDKRMRDFVLKKFDVLVCTTIVESGLDIPNANTIFINNADRFGLAELHQLRGRVGREKRQAYCYLMVEDRMLTSTNALKRLRAIEEYDKLGSGFQIAMRDLEIRGTGNLLGKEQSGHIAMIGYEMYRDFLAQAVAKLKGLDYKTRLGVEIDLGVSELLPSSYIADDSVKLDFYRRFDRVITYEDANELKKELEDRFGRLPVEGQRIFLKAKLRIAAEKYNIRLIRVQRLKDVSRLGDRFLVLEFPESKKRFLLQEELKKRNIVMQLLPSAKARFHEGLIQIPPTVYPTNDRIDHDRMLSFVLGLFPEIKESETVKESENDLSDSRTKKAARVKSKEKGKDAKPAAPQSAPLKNFMKKRAERDAKK